jgi:hypothetical protein
MILRQILDRIAQGGTWTVESLAKELDTDSRLVAMMIEDLERRGYLKRVTGNCGSNCASCALTNGCIKDTSQKMWTLAKTIV